MQFLLLVKQLLPDIGTAVEEHVDVDLVIKINLQCVVQTLYSKLQTVINLEHYFMELQLYLLLLEEEIFWQKVVENALN